MDPQQEALNNVTTTQAVSSESVEYQQRHPHPVLLGGAIGVSDPPPAGWRTASCPQLFLLQSPPPIRTPLPSYMNRWTRRLPPRGHLKPQALFTATYSAATLSSQRETGTGGCGCVSVWAGADNLRTGSLQLNRTLNMHCGGGWSDWEIPGSSFKMLDVRERGLW